MDLQKINEKIIAKQNDIETIEKQIREKHIENESLKTNYAKEVLAGDKSEFFETVKKALLDSRYEADSLDGVLELLQGEMVELEKEKTLAELYTSQAVRFQTSMDSCEETHKQLTALMKSLKTDLNRFNQCVSSIISSQEQAKSAFKSLMRGLDDNMSLTSFLDGRIIEFVDESDYDHEATKIQVQNQLLTTSEINIKEIEAEFIDFQSSMEKVAQWTTFAAKNLDGKAAFVPKPQRRQLVTKSRHVDYSAVKSAIRLHPQNWPEGSLEEVEQKERRQRGLR